MGNLRLDTKKAVAVNKGLATALLVNIQSGVKVMCEAGVPAETAVRIILHPRRRRADDWKHE